MRSRIGEIMVRVLALVGVSGGLAACGVTQAINLDFDIGIGDPELGNGAPSSSFGAAAGQPGFWNRVGFGANPVPLLGTDGLPTSVVMDVKSSGGYFGTGFRNETNTGDYALLLNDATAIGALGPGGHKSYEFEGFSKGSYLIYTYAVAPSGYEIDTPIYVEQAVQQQLQIVTGPMPGNSFGYLVTHSIHEVMIDSEAFSIFIHQPPKSSNGMHVNGIQVVPVPETNSTITIAALCSLLFIRKPSSC